MRQPAERPTTIRNEEIADLFDELADLLEIEDANPFRVRAYRNAARTIRAHPREMAELIDSGTALSELPDIGKDLESKIRTVVATGKLPALEEAAAQTPRSLSRLMKVEGLGPRRVKTLYRELDIRSAEDLKRAVREGRIRRLPGFGGKLERLIGEHLDRMTAQEGRTKLALAERTANALVEHLRSMSDLRDVTVAGSYRRRRETVGDLDIVVTARKAAAAMEHFTRFDGVETIVSKGRTRSTVRLRTGMQVDLRVVPRVSYGAALLYFTGSKAHNIALRKLAVRRGYKINEYGVYDGDQRIAGKTENEIYELLGLAYIEPELREDRGEIEAAGRGGLPELVTQRELRGDLHCHTKASDGRHSLEQMAAAAADRGHEYLAITDHSKRVTVANGLDEKRLLRQIETIDRLNEARDDIVLLKSAEVDILEDGRLDLPQRILKKLDLTVCSVHYRLDLPQRRQTERVLRAMDNPFCNIVAHPTGRLIDERPPYAVDLAKIIEGAKERGCFLEVDAQPDRLDLNDEACRLAKEIGARVSISSDAHSVDQLELQRFGVDQARRGWLSADDVVNTRPLDELKALLARA